MRSIRHIPHDSTHIPDHYRDQFLLTESQMELELLRMTDRHTTALFDGNPEHDVIFEVSRLLLDVERFEDDADEPMAARGMGVIYTHTHDCQPMRRVLSDDEREKLLATYYRPHHSHLEQRVEVALNSSGRALVIDCHSFPSQRQPYEIGGDGFRAEICIGTDSFHTPSYLRDAAMKCFSDAGFSVTVDTPFSGALTPLNYFGKDHRVKAIMIEVRRDLYMDENTGARGERFEDIRNAVKQVIELLESMD